ncbi:hypothetical protein JOQ06_029638 [Pogonophryne albipinna]|uniref:Uncharacterized protein n=3 Tax=Notothenioidei TaxID=8205 RepID=A0AAN8DJJ5_CHAGU|nr:hypothetical protein JOQ06_029638 [Pogonophryne albipinna]KAK5890610.1 hypothetical protein CesoFtcFv8_014114 [Champsocephalus esox]KAK5921150.1 hypothetical protein CgunFtcFv8_024876 [Champsocephalus gunnari]
MSMEGRRWEPGMDTHPPTGHSVSPAQYELTTSWQHSDNTIFSVWFESQGKALSGALALHTEGTQCKAAQWSHYV